MTQPGTKRIALIDLDGTVADYDAAIKSALDKMHAPSEPLIDDWETPWIKERVRAIRQVPGFWRNLARFELGFKIVGILQQRSFDLHVLTKAPVSASNAWTEKAEWARLHLPDAKIHVCEDKSIVYGKVLVDDWEEYALEWLKHRPRGVVFMPANKRNEKVDHPQILRVARFDDLLTVERWIEEKVDRRL